MKDLATTHIKFAVSSFIVKVNAIRYSVLYAKHPANPSPSHHPQQSSEFLKQELPQGFSEKISNIFFRGHIGGVDCSYLNLPSDSVEPNTNVFGFGEIRMPRTLARALVLSE